MGDGVELRMESDGRSPAAGKSALSLQLLGPLEIARDGVALKLPPSRKVKGLIAYLALAAQPVTRGHLCEMLWEVPNDPRGELRWCLSKARALLDEPGRRRVASDGDTVALDLSDCFVDAVEIERATQGGIEAIDAETLRTLPQLFGGDFLDGMELDRSPLFSGWLIGQRHRFRDRHVALLQRLAALASPDELLARLEAWRQLAPLDRRVHERLLDALAQRGRLQEGEEHLAAALRLFASEGLDGAKLRAAWRQARAGAEPRVKIETQAPPAVVETNAAEAAAGVARRAAVAVMPFVERGGDASQGGGLSAEGLVHDVITRLAKLRSLLVIAQGTVFALHERGIAPAEAARTLNVDYLVSGSFERRGTRAIITVELTDTRTAQIVFADGFEYELSDLLQALDQIGNRIVALVAGEIEASERNRAILKPPNSLNAWEKYHRGLWHMYRFNRDDNERAQRFFADAVRLDPTFSRAHAGLSFTHFQNAFQGWTTGPAEIAASFEAAGQSLMADERDPAAHCAMGRALWLRGRLDQAVPALERAVELSPNFVLGHYSLAFVHSQAGDARAAIANADLSRQLSPFDPLLFAMMGARAMALSRLGEFDQAAEWAMKAAARPNAHVHIRAIAAYTLALAGRTVEAAAYFASVRRQIPGYGIDDFLTAMHFNPDDAAAYRAAARRSGLA